MKNNERRSLMKKTAASSFMVYVFILALLLLVPLTGLAKEPVLRMATTTSTDNTGLLDYLAPVFQEDMGIELQWVAVGTGRALALGKNCDVDILMVHAPAAEKQYVADGFGTDRKEFMFNDFVIIGPAADTSMIAGKSVKEALTQISSEQAIFVSRGDDSGTHKREISLWKASGLPVPDRESWYVQTGQGMIATITIAEERDGYTMTDRGTYIKYADNRGGNPELVILVEGDVNLKNQYSVIAIDPDHCPSTQYALALKFIEWVTDDRAQRLIGGFKLLGKQLFTPNAE
jgi:tungstate transport system substrate-binding protein